MLARIAVAVIALGVIGWLAVMERGRAALRARHRSRWEPRQPDDDRAGGADLEDARLLTPDRTPDVGRALILWTAGRSADARTALEDVVASEPDNLSAWTALGWVNAGADPALERRVAAEMRRLDPLSGGRPPPSPGRPPPGR